MTKVPKEWWERYYVGGRIDMIKPPDINIHPPYYYDMPLMTAYGKGDRTIITPAYSPLESMAIVGANMREFFMTMDHEETPPEIDRLWRELRLHLKSQRAKCYSECCRHWLNEPLDDLSVVMENRGFLLLERSLVSQVADVRYAAMCIYMHMATVLEPPYPEGEEE